MLNGFDLISTVKLLNWKTILAKVITHTSTYSTYLIIGFIMQFPRDFQHIIHSMCTQKPTEHHQTLLPRV